jgi:hypothetical protein
VVLTLETDDELTELEELELVELELTAVQSPFLIRNFNAFSCMREFLCHCLWRASFSSPTLLAWCHSLCAMISDFFHVFRTALHAFLSSELLLEERTLETDDDEASSSLPSSS